MRSYSAAVLEAWSTWELLRKLGFSSDDIHWEFSNVLNAIPRPGMCLNIILKTQGKEMMITCSTRLSEGEARRMHNEADVFQARIVAGDFTEEEMREVFESSYAWREHVSFVLALKSKGFEFPFKTLN